MVYRQDSNSAVILHIKTLVAVRHLCHHPGIHLFSPNDGLYCSSDKRCYFEPLRGSVLCLSFPEAHLMNSPSSWWCLCWLSRSPLPFRHLVAHLFGCAFGDFDLSFWTDTTGPSVTLEILQIVIGVEKFGLASTTTDRNVCTDRIRQHLLIDWLQGSPSGTTIFIDRCRHSQIPGILSW